MELVGVKEAAELLKWTKQRVATTFRKRVFPVAELAAGPIWTRKQVESYATGEKAEAEDNVPELVSVKEVADMLGWSRQRVTMTLKRKAFPEPIAELACGSIWTKNQIEEYIKEKTLQMVEEEKELTYKNPYNNKIAYSKYFKSHIRAVEYVNDRNWKFVRCKPDGTMFGRVLQAQSPAGAFTWQEIK